MEFRPLNHTQGVKCVSPIFGCDPEETADFAELACEARPAKSGDIPKTRFRPIGSQDFRKLLQTEPANMRQIASNHYSEST